MRKYLIIYFAIIFIVSPLYAASLITGLTATGHDCIAFLKDTNLYEGSKLEFRAELFNAFNHTQFGQPNGNINDAAFGLVTTARPPRIVQMSLKLLF
jgi:hypothetical protein